MIIFARTSLQRDSKNGENNPTPYIGLKKLSFENYFIVCFVLLNFGV